jgi:hypothetical protein
VAGPAKGLLPGEAGSPAGAFPEVRFDDSQKSRMGPVKLTDRRLSETDQLVLKDLSDKVDAGEALTKKDREFLNGLYKNGLESERIRDISNRSRAVEDKIAALKAYPETGGEPPADKPQPKGLLTSLNVEKGPTKEIPDAKGQIGEIRRTTEGVKGIVHPTEADIQAHVDSVNHRWMDEISKKIQSGGRPTKEDGSRLFKLSQKFENPELSERAQSILDRWETGEDVFQKTAEAERLKKNVVSVDVPKVKPKAPTGPVAGEVWTGPSGKEYTVIATEKEGGKTYVKVKHLDTSGGRTDGQMITSWEEADDPKVFYGRKSRGESGPPGKKELIDDLMSGKTKVPGIKPKGKPTKPKGKK